MIPHELDPSPTAAASPADAAPAAGAPEALVPFHFGPADRRMLGLFHPARGGVPADRGVLLCNAFGQEAVRGHRLYRVLADRLAKRGLPTLRFDYHATGDSPGDDEDGDLEGWERDVRAAAHELARRGGVRSIVCVGGRLGAALALRGAAGAPGVSRLVLWDPIVDGAAYLKTLQVRHVEALEGSFSRHDPAWRLALANDPEAFATEALGFGISARLREQLRRLTGHELSVPPGLDTVVIAASGEAGVHAWSSAQLQRGAALRAHALEIDFDWPTEESRNTPLVPAQALQCLQSAICE